MTKQLHFTLKCYAYFNTFNSNHLNILHKKSVLFIALFATIVSNLLPAYYPHFLPLRYHLTWP